MPTPLSTTSCSKVKPFSRRAASNFSPSIFASFMRFCRDLVALVLSGIGFYKLKHESQRVKLYPLLEACA